MFSILDLSYKTNSRKTKIKYILSLWQNLTQSAPASEDKELTPDRKKHIHSERKWPPLLNRETMDVQASI